MLGGGINKGHGQNLRVDLRRHPAREGEGGASQIKDGFYFGSLPGALPGRVRSLPNYEALVIGLDGGRLWQQVQPVLI